MFGSIGPSNLFIKNNEIYICGYRCPSCVLLTEESLYICDSNGVQQFDVNDNFSFVKRLMNIGACMTIANNRCYISAPSVNGVYVLR